MNFALCAAVESPPAPDPVENGRKLWDQAEFAILLSIGNNRLKVGRGIFDTKPAAFGKGAWVAPVLTRSGYLGNETCRLYHYSIDCPRDEKGRNCADAQCDLLYDWFKPGGPLERMHGIEPGVFPDGTPDVERLERERRRLAWATASILGIAITADGIKVRLRS